MALFVLVLLVIPSLPVETQASDECLVIHKIFMPTMSSGLDNRVGNSEYTCEELPELGFACGNPERYHAHSIDGMPSDQDTVLFGWSAHRRFIWASEENPEGPNYLYCLFVYELEGHKNVCTGETATRTGLFDEEGMCEYLSDKPWISLTIGNEESSRATIISSDLSPGEYAGMYRAFEAAVEGCSSETKIGPYAPVQWHGEGPFPQKLYIRAWLAEYKELVGKEPETFGHVSLHFYYLPGSDLETNWAALLALKADVAEEYGETEVEAWIVSEYGPPCWRPEIPREGPEIEQALIDMSCRLQETNVFDKWAFWGKWSCYLLDNENVPTPLGRLYRRIAAGTSLNAALEAGACD